MYKRVKCSEEKRIKIQSIQMVHDKEVYLLSIHLLFIAQVLRIGYITPLKGACTFNWRIVRDTKY